MYDLLSTSISKNMSSAFAFSIGGQRYAGKMKKKNFEMLAEALGFNKKKDIVVTTMREMSNLVEDKIETLWAEISDDDRFRFIKNDLRNEIQSRLNLFKTIM